MAVRWVKISEIVEAFEERHPEFTRAFECVEAAFLGEPRPVRDTYNDPPV